MKALLLAVVLLAGCRKPDPEIERALDQLQATYREECVERKPEPAMMMSCVSAQRELHNWGRK